MKPAIIRLDRKRQFIYNLKALRELETALGEPLFSIFQGDMELDKFSFDFMLKIIWAGMLEEEELTLEEVEKIIPTEGFIQVFTECIKLLVGTIGTMQGSDSKEAKKKLEKNLAKAS